MTAAFQYLEYRLDLVGVRRRKMATLEKAKSRSTLASRATQTHMERLLDDTRGMALYLGHRISFCNTC
jgi:hypothetical protein